MGGGFPRNGSRASSSFQQDSARRLRPCPAALTTSAPKRHPRRICPGRGARRATGPLLFVRVAFVCCAARACGRRSLHANRITITLSRGPGMQGPHALRVGEEMMLGAQRAYRCSRSDAALRIGDADWATLSAQRARRGYASARVPVGAPRRGFADDGENRRGSDKALHEISTPSRRATAQPEQTCFRRRGGGAAGRGCEGEAAATARGIFLTRCCKSKALARSSARGSRARLERCEER